MRWKPWTAVLCALAALCGPASAQSAWPERPVRMTLTFGAGSGLDIIARLFQDQLQTRWGKPIVIEHRPGGDGMVAINAFMTAADPHVLLMASTGSFLSHPFTMDKVPYNVKTDLAPIARFSDTITAYVVPSSLGVTSLKELFARARAEPGKLNYAAGAGITEFTLSAFVKIEGLNMGRVPYRDIVQAGADLGEGRLHLLFTSLAILKPHIDSGKARMVGQGLTRRVDSLPDVPSVVEQGYPGLVTETSSSLFGPKGMELSLRERIAADIIAVGRDPTIGQRLAAMGLLINLTGPADLADTIDRQFQRGAAVANALGPQRGK